MHGTAMMSLMLLSLPIAAQMTLAFILMASMFYHLWRYAWLAAPSSNVTLLLEGERIVLVSRRGEQIPGKVMPDSLITPFITVLNILPQNSRWVNSVVILPDSMDAESFRQLRVSLKWGR